MTKLVGDYSVGARAVSVPCFVCGKMHKLCESTIDLDGPAFQAYYCKPCAELSFGTSSVDRIAAEAKKAAW